MSNAVILTSDGSNLTAEEDHAVRTFAYLTGVQLDLRETDLPGHGWRLNRIRSCERILLPPPGSSDYGVEITRLPISRADFVFHNLRLASEITVDKTSAQLLQSVFPVLTGVPFSGALYNTMSDSSVDVLTGRGFERNSHHSGLFVRVQSVRGSRNLNICFSNQSIPRDLNAGDFESVAGYWNGPHDDRAYSPERFIEDGAPGADIQSSEGEAEDPRVYGQWPSPPGRGGNMDEPAYSGGEEASSQDGFVRDDAPGDSPGIYIEDSEGEAEVPWTYAQLSSPPGLDGDFDADANSQTASEDAREREEHEAMLARTTRVHTIFYEDGTSQTASEDAREREEHEAMLARATRVHTVSDEYDDESDSERDVGTS